MKNSTVNNILNDDWLPAITVLKQRCPSHQLLPMWSWRPQTGPWPRGTKDVSTGKEAVKMTQ